MAEVRSLTRADWRALKKVRLGALRESPDAFGQPFAEAALLDDDAWKALAAGEAPPVFLIAYEGTEPCGLIGGVDGDEGYHLISMWVAPPFRGGGAAGLLVEALVEHARALGHTEIVLWVSENNPRARQFYLNAKFEFMNESGPLRSNPAILTHKMRRRIGVSPQGA